MTRKARSPRGLHPQPGGSATSLVGVLGSAPFLELTTMCGHAMIAANLVRRGIKDVASRAKTPRDASNMLGAPCVCGIFNLDRSDALLARRAETAQHA